MRENKTARDDPDTTDWHHWISVKASYLCYRPLGISVAFFAYMLYRATFQHPSYIAFVQHLCSGRFFCQKSENIIRPTIECNNLNLDAPNVITIFWHTEHGISNMEAKKKHFTLFPIDINSGHFCFVRTFLITCIKISRITFCCWIFILRSSHFEPQSCIFASVLTVRWWIDLCIFDLHAPKFIECKR